VGNLPNGGYFVRVEIIMLERNDKDGKITPIAFYLEDPNGDKTRIKIEKVINCEPIAELKSGMVGDRYECLIDGQREYLYYSKLLPRHWYIIKKVTEEEYIKYYPLPDRVNTRIIREI